eukprot:gene42121-52221_t
MSRDVCDANQRCDRPLTTSSVSIFQLVQYLQKSDGSLHYNSRCYLLLNYTSLALLEANALVSGLSPALFFHVAALLALDKSTNGTDTASAVSEKLRAYVVSQGVSGEVIAKVAELLSQIEH